MVNAMVRVINWFAIEVNQLERERERQVKCAATGRRDEVSGSGSVTHWAIGVRKIAIKIALINGNKCAGGHG